MQHQTITQVSLSFSRSADPTRSTDAVEAFLLFFNLRGPLPKQVDRFNTLLLKWADSPDPNSAVLRGLADDLENFDPGRVDELGLSEKAKEMLKALVALRQKNDGKEEEELVSDVRNL